MALAAVPPRLSGSHVDVRRKPFEYKRRRRYRTLLAAALPHKRTNAYRVHGLVSLSVVIGADHAQLSLEKEN